MKTKLVSLFLFTAMLVSAADKIVAGPKGGRLLPAEPQKAEFFVNAERKVEVTFYDAALKAVAPGDQVIVVTAEAKEGKVALLLEKTATGFVSKTALPVGDPYRVVVQLRANADAKPKNFRVDLNLAQCGECSYKEYACTCGH